MLPEVNNIYLTDEERTLIYNLVNSVQCGVLSKFHDHIEALKRFDEINSTNLANIWYKESSKEFEMLQIIKRKVKK